MNENTKTTESKAQERREAEQRRRLDELRAHAAAAQAQREKRDEDRRKRQAEQRAKDEDRRQQVEERKRAIWEASVSRREALLQRERERTERLERARAARSNPRSAFAFGSSTPRLLEPDSGFFWSARSNFPIDQMNFFEELAASTTNVMFASTTLSRPASALQLDSENNKDEPERTVPMWSSVARRRTDLVPTLPAPRAPGRAYSMTRLDKIPSQRTLHSASPSMHHLNRTQTRSGETTPGSRPGSAMSNATGVVRRIHSAPRKPRPASIAGTGVNTPRGGGDTAALSVATTPSVSRDSTVMAAGDVPRRPQTTPRRPRPLSMRAPAKSASMIPPGEGKPPLHRKPKPSKDQGKSLSASPGRTLSPSPSASKEPSVNREVSNKHPTPPGDKSQVSAIEVTQKLEALQIQNGETPVTAPTAPLDEKKDDKMEESDMTASMTAKRITTEEEAKAALAERRRRAREELEKQAELERQRLQREAEEEAERQRQEEERQKREEEEARELARLQRSIEEEKLRKAIEAQQQLEREEAERKVKEELERQARLKEEEEKRKAAEEAERLRKEEAEKEEKERLARKQRVEAIMSRTRLRGAKNEDEKKSSPNTPASVQNPSAKQMPDNGNAAVGDLLGFDTSQTESVESKSPQTNNTATEPAPAAAPSANNNNGNVTGDLLGLAEQNNDKQEVSSPANKQSIPLLATESAPVVETNNGNVLHGEAGTNVGVGHISASFIETERMSAELIDDDFAAHNGHGTTHNHPLTLQNAI